MQFRIPIYAMVKHLIITRHSNNDESSKRIFNDQFDMYAHVM